ncbi:MFS transporter [Tindallia californiensis]|uniref:Lysosomal dipeptide transporter MFSD1 n=1 Tax=Tindallia californiensis TaxID=159292 RepID=A0A1H3PV75_9FIRM|nr:MFS transporter [Tindallia californiensis]SDZ04848.1 Sugar phosphate permease [Tindallia californiensis]
MKKISSKYVVWLVFGLAFMIGFFHRYSIGIIADPLREDLLLSTAGISLLSSMYFYTYGFLQIPCGIMVDAQGPRRVVLMGMSAVFIGSIFFALSPTPILLYIARALIGFGAATVFTSIFKIQALWFKPTEFATIAGMTAVIGNVGGMLATAPFYHLTNALGWRGGHLILAIITLMPILIIYGWITDRPPAKNDAEEGKEEYKKLEKSTEKQPQKQLQKQPQKITEGLKVVVSNPYAWVNAVILFMVFGSYMSFSGLWGPHFLRYVYEIPLEQAANLIMIYMAGVLIGSPAIGMISDRLQKRKRVLQTALLLLVAGWAMMILILPAFQKMWLLIPVLFITGSVSISPMLCFTNTKELIPQEYTGIATGFVNMAPFFGTSVINSLFAWFLRTEETAATYQAGALLFLLAAIIGFTASFLMKEGLETKANKMH